ncbi:TetR/AcrR family transcriptional regulator [Kribbella sp. CA-293567]|uniref:TetR/AcrR family transcriptional regulator n=1 Tax=Kribbella sp. CA-293567 TaxID=3002436 RepID=UPI0022DE911F|nr:TetR/AcrR family transcriptional regulator C-terminal domain-containing protein [Kribbella sp. CA-293567]WBQ05652.1 TetR/AcrR family transcriptional regulator C-terminal domain-containing protein [Kribbella sp. CA-293567]
MVNAGKPGRPRAGEERLSRQAILEAALRIVDDEGIEAMTMRRLAATLGVNPMSIYHHLPNKAAVFAGLAELVFAQLESSPPDDSVSWQDELKSAATAYRDALRAHPNLALQVLSDTSAVSDVVVVTVEPFYRALDRAGASPRQIFEAVNTIIDFIHGFSLGEASVGTDTFDLAPDLLSRISSLPAGKAPTLVRVVTELGAEGLKYDFGSGFATGISLLVDGIEARFSL